MKENPVLPNIRSSKGFTLLEVVVVLILLGILTAVAIARVVDHGADERAATDTLITHLRFAQILAMNSDTTWGININGATYTLYADGNVNNNPANLPGEDSHTITMPVSAGVSTVSFDQWGRPYNTVDPSSSSPATGNINISIGSETITIIPDTGYIP